MRGKNTNILSHFKVLPTCVVEIMFMLTGFCLEKVLFFDQRSLTVRPFRLCAEIQLRIRLPRERQFFSVACYLKKLNVLNAMGPNQ